VKSISTRFTFWTVVISTLILVAIIGVNYIFIKNQLLISVNNKAKLEIIKSQNKIDKILFKSIKSSRRAKNLLKKQGLKQNHITTILTDILKSNPYLYGMAAAMEPKVIYDKEFCPYFYKKGSHIVYVDLATQRYKYLIQPWYLNAKKSTTAKWSEPYFDKGGGNILMATYSNPLFQGSKFAGVVTIDLSLEKLKQIVSSVHILDTGYAFLLSQKNTILVYPNNQLLMKSYTNKIKYNQIIKEKNRWIYYAKIQSTGWTLGIVMPENELFGPLNKITMISIILAIFGIFLLIIAMYITSKNITKPLKEIIKVTNEISNGNFDKHIEKPRIEDEIYQLFISIKKMQNKIKNYISNLKIATQKEEMIKSELAIAKKIQMDMLPVAQDCKPEYSIDLYASLKPAKAVGGDFYDFFHIGDDKLCFVIADVSGKGVPAALFMAVCVSYIRAYSSKDLNPSDIVEKVNNALCVNNEACMFVTMLLAIIDLKTSEMSYVNAGHTKPYLFSSTKKPIQIKSKNDPIVGAMEDIKFTNFNLKLEKGEKLFLYTDGVNEAFSANGEQFGEKRVEETLQDISQLKAKYILKTMSQKISNFCKDAEQSDDITMFMVACKEE